MYALEARTGQILWSVASGAAVVNGVVYWGSGYLIGAEHNALYAFSTAG